MHTTADLDGKILSGYFVPGLDVPQLFTLTAIGEVSGPSVPVTFANSLDFASINLAATASALVQTDKSDYSPGQTAIITGTGWLAGETVNLEIVEDLLAHPTESLHTIANNKGNIVAGYVVDGHDLGRSFTLTATGQISGLTAQTVFTDAPPISCSTDADCNDGNACTNDSCGPSHTCQYNSNTNGNSCADSNVCNGAEVCQGGTCRAGTNATSGRACGGSDAACDALDTCNGSGVCVDNVKVADTVCNPAGANATCDPADVCDGTTKVCAPILAAEFTPCGDSDATACNAADSCNGSGSCVDRVKAQNVECKAANGICDPADVCDGINKTCEPKFADAGIACTSDANPCTVDACDGAGACAHNPPEGGSDSCNAVTDSSLCPLPTFVTCSVPPNSNDSPLCPLPQDQFRLISIQDPSGTDTNNYRLNASNPGQFYYNVFYKGNPSEPVNLTINIPYPFVTQGAEPIQVYDGAEQDTETCLLPGSSVLGCTITTEGPNFSPSGAEVIAITDYDPQNIGNSSWVTIKDCNVPSSGVYYVTLHLDYGLKKTTGWDKINTNDGSHNEFDTGDGLVTIFDGEEYTFSFGDGGPSIDSHTIASINAFKNNPGVAGLTLQSGSANPKGNINVQLLNSSGVVVGTATTDADGFYQIFYKHTGKAANYTVNLPNLKIKQTVQLKANGFAAVLFENLP